MKNTHYRKAITSVLIDEIDALLRLQHKRQLQKVPKVWEVLKGEDIDGLMPWLQTVDRRKKECFDGKYLGLVVRLLRAKGIVSNQLDLAETVLHRLHGKAGIIDHMAHLPPARKEVRQRAARPATLVGRRAAKARELLDKWQSKLRLAKTKVAKYQRKVKYYKDKYGDREEVANAQ